MQNAVGICLVEVGVKGGGWRLLKWSSGCWTEWPYLTQTSLLLACVYTVEKELSRAPDVAHHSGATYLGRMNAAAYQQWWRIWAIDYEREVQMFGQSRNVTGFTEEFWKLFIGWNKSCPAFGVLPSNNIQLNNKMTLIDLPFDNVNIPGLNLIFDVHRWHTSINQPIGAQHENTKIPTRKDHQ